jgi:hypothetical protein
LGLNPEQAQTSNVKIATLFTDHNDSDSQPQSMQAELSLFQSEPTPAKLPSVLTFSAY